MSEKSWPDVADRAIGGMADLARAVEAVTPDAWRAAVAYHRAEAIGDLVTAAATLFICVAAIAAMWIVAKRTDDGSDLPPLVVCSFAAAVIAMVVICGIPSEIAAVISPEYKAAEAIIKAAGGCK